MAVMRPGDGSGRWPGESIRCAIIGAMSKSQSSHTGITIVVVAAALVIALAFVSAFIWPGWALSKPTAQPAATASSSSSEPTTPTIKAKELPADATELLKAMPDSVLNFARTEAVPSADWTGASPLEEYTLTYSAGDDAKNVTLVVGQWSSSDAAKQQYESLAAGMKGEELGSGSVKVSGNATGSYVAKADDSDPAKAIAVWQNDTVVFQAKGDKASVERFYQKFPL